MKRHKWSKEEDECLRRVVGEVGEGDWEEVARIMSRSGFRKSRKQVSDRWNLQLRPGINKLSITFDEKLALFAAQRESKNSWKLLPSRQRFPTRSCMWLKTQFFLVVRQAIRKAKKFLEDFSETQRVTLIKPGAILKFMDEPIELEGEDVLCPVPSWLKSGFEGRELIVFFSTTPSHVIEPLKSTRFLAAVKTALARLDNINSLHCKLKAFRLKAYPVFSGLQASLSRLEEEAAELTELIDPRVFFLEKKSLSLQVKATFEGALADPRTSSGLSARTNSALADLKGELDDFLGSAPEEPKNIFVEVDTVSPKSLIFNFSCQLSLFSALFSENGLSKPLESRMAKTELAHLDSPTARTSTPLAERDLELN